MSTATVTPLVRSASTHLPQRPPQQAANLTTAVLEALMGRRPLHQLRPYLTADAFRVLSLHVDRATLRRGRVIRLRAQMPTRRAVEASATVEVEGRAVSCVFRLDVGNAAWRCTHLTVLTPLGARAAA